MAALEEKTHFDSSMSENCVVIIYQVTLILL